MKLIKSSFEIIEQQPGIDGMYKQIELAGRTCYKSENKITQDSAKEFVGRMAKSGHGAMLEHGTVYLYAETISFVNRDGDVEYYNPLEAYESCPFSAVVQDANDAGIEGLYVTTNYRVLVENNWTGDLKYLCEPTQSHMKRITVRFICDRAVANEFVRHRVFSFAQESTRYCNYSKDKFGNELTFILPCWIDDKLTIEDPFNNEVYKSLDEPTRDFVRSLQYSEFFYLSLIEKGWKPQEVRAVLPNALKTELVMTGFISDWKHFFELRCANNAHPQARELAVPLREEFIRRGLIEDLHE